MMSTARRASRFDPAQISILGLDHSTFSRSIIMEVLRGIGLNNGNVLFEDFRQVLDYGTGQFHADIAFISHGQDEPLDLLKVQKLRRLNHRSLSEIPVILLSSLVTRSLIQQARDAGIDEIVMRPVAPRQLQMKMKKVIEAPRPFITASNYVGPCRRRQDSESYEGLRRRLDDFEQTMMREIPPVENADALTKAVTELRSACGELSDERLGLVARVRETAGRTMTLAQETNDAPLAQTAAAVRMYLDGVGSTNLIEPHVLETGINALSQLSVLPQSYQGARKSIASLMTIAVRKKLAHYQNRGLGYDPDSERLLDQINGSGDDVEQSQGADTDAYDLDGDAEAITA